MAEKTYYEMLFTESEEEKKIDEEIQSLIEEFESTQEYRAYKDKLHGLYHKQHEAMVERMKNAKEERPLRTKKINPLTDEEKATKMAEIKAKKAEEYNLLPEGLKSVIEAYKSLSDAEKKKFQQETWCFHEDIDNIENPQTTEKDIKELQEILVQTTIDFINERGLKDIEEVSFSADSLQSSAENGTWVCSTDSFIHVYGIGDETTPSGKTFKVRKSIGEYM